MEEQLNALKESSKKQEKYAKRTFYMTAISAACCVLILTVAVAAYFSLVPRLKSSLKSIEQTAQNLSEISQELNEADLSGMIQDVDSMVVTSEEGVRRALSKIDSINIEELNNAIGALSDTVNTLRKFTDLFR